MVFMKKWLIGLTVIILLLVVCSYVFIPERINISEEVLVNCTPGGAMRILIDENKWKKWWPGNNSTDPDLLLRRQKYLRSA